MQIEIEGRRAEDYREPENDLSYDRGTNLPQEPRVESDDDGEIDFPYDPPIRREETYREPGPTDR